MTEVRPRVLMFLDARDKARCRGDGGIDRACTMDLRQLGVPDDATYEFPEGRPAEQSPAQKRRPGRPPKPRCEHGRIADRCVECAEAEIAEARPRQRLSEPAA